MQMDAEKMYNDLASGQQTSTDGTGTGEGCDTCGDRVNSVKMITAETEIDVKKHKTPKKSDGNDGKDGKDGKEVRIFELSYVLMLFFFNFYPLLLLATLNQRKVIQNRKNKNK